MSKFGIAVIAVVGDRAVECCPCERARAFWSRPAWQREIRVHE